VDFERGSGDYGVNYWQVAVIYPKRAGTPCRDAKTQVSKRDTAAGHFETTSRNK